LECFPNPEKIPNILGTFSKHSEKIPNIFGIFFQNLEKIPNLLEFFPNFIKISLQIWNYVLIVLKGVSTAKKHYGIV
jgi:hypothetical protein